MFKSRQNPNFDYKALVARRDRFYELLSEWGDYPEEPDAISSELKDLLSPCASTFDLLRFMTPYYIEVLAISFSEPKAPHFAGIDYDAAKHLAEIVYDEDGSEDTIGRALVWVLRVVEDLYVQLPAQMLGDTFNEVVRVYNKCAVRGCAFTFTFPTTAEGAETLADDLGARLSTHLAHVSERDCVVRVDFGLFEVESASGFLGVLFSYLTERHHEFRDIVLYDDCVAYIREYRPGTPMPVPRLRYSKVGPDLAYMPFWASAAPYRVSFFTELVHFTTLVSAGKRVTADSMRTKTSDYAWAPAATYGRDIEPRPRGEDGRRALAFAWGREFLCKYGWEKHALFKHASDQIFGYSAGGAFMLFTQSALTVVKADDHTLQSVSLLDQIEEVIPCVLTERYDSSSLHFGLQPDGRNPLFEVDDVGWDKTKNPFVCYALDLICEYLSGDDYNPAENINETCVLCVGKL